MIKSLTGLRAIAAIVVMLYHLWSGTLATEACMAMIAMMAMSGMVNAMHNGTMACSGRNYWRYVAQRLVRIVPLHWLTLGMLLAAGSHTIGWDLLANALLLHAWVPDLAVCYGYNTMSWFLSALIPCYLLLPSLCRALRQISVKWQVGGLVAVLIAEAAWLTTLPSGQFAVWAAYVAPPVQLINFAGGIVACNVCLSMPRHTPSTRHATVAELAMVAILAALAWTSHTGPLPARLGAPYSLWALLLAMATLTRTAGSGAIVTRFLSCKVMQWLGGISFEMFMLHGMVCAALLAAAPAITSLPWGVQAAICIVPVAITSWIVNRLLRVITNSVKKRITKIKS